MTAVADIYVKELKCRSFFKCDTCGRTAQGDNFTRLYPEPKGLQYLARITPNMHVPNSKMPVGWSAQGDVHTCAECRSMASA